MQLPAISAIITKNIKKDEFAKYLDFVSDFKNEKAQRYNTIILTLAASIILGIFAISPTISTIANLQKQLEDDKFLEQKLQQKISNLSSLQQKYSEIQNDLPIIYSAIPKGSEIPSLLALTQGISKETNTSLNGFQTSKLQLSNSTTSNNKYSSFDFGIRVQGDYVSLVNFIDKLSNFQRIITLSGVAIAKSTDNNNTLLQLTIQGTAYFKN